MATVDRTLLAWYRSHKRDLPWRKTRDPYRIFVSELMLQQTQVDRVVPKYQGWLKTFPSWKTLANATTAGLIHAWAGLGYNRRALYAREAARDVVKNGAPQDEKGWRTLRGVGPYMAAALTEFVNGRRAIVIDTNIRRVVGRIFLGKPFPRPADDARIRPVLERITPRTNGHRDLPQAFMDFANAVCLPRSPRCTDCPLYAQCRAGKKFLRGTVRAPSRKKITERMHREKKYPDRIYRGRILAWVRTHGPTRHSELGTHIDDAYDPIADRDWVRAMCARLVADGLLAWVKKDSVSLP